MYSKAGLDHTALEEFENKGPTRKTHQLFSVHSTPEELKNARINYNLPSFSKSSVFKEEVSRRCQKSVYLNALFSFQSFKNIKDYIDYAKGNQDLSIVAGGKCDDR